MIDYSERNNCYSYDLSLWNVWSKSQVLRCFSKFSDGPLFRPNLFIKGDSRMRWGPFHVKLAKKSSVMVMFHCSTSNLPCYLSNIIIHSIVNTSEQFNNHILWGPQLTIVWLAININFPDLTWHLSLWTGIYLKFLLVNPLHGVLCFFFNSFPKVLVV